jgi:phage recombination protein Bet
MSESLVVSQPKELIVTADQMTIARNTVAKGLSDDEFSVYLYNCHRQSIHPLDGLLVPISRNDSESGSKRLTFVSTVDLLRSRAADTGDYAGNEDPVFESVDGAKNPQSASVSVWKFVRGEKCQFTATARWGEYYPGDGKAGFMWRAKPHVMLGKCAEALALRKAFPKQLAGLYVAEELEQDAPQVSRPGKKAEAPVPGVKCSECNAEGGHLPSCSKRKQDKPAEVKKASEVKKPEEKKSAPKSDGPVICSECRGQITYDPITLGMNGHKADCKFTAKTQPAKQEAAADPNKEAAKPVLFKIVSVAQKSKKPTEAQKKKNVSGDPFFVVEALALDGTSGKIYVFDTKFFDHLAGKKDVMLICEVSKNETADGKVFFSLKHILELDSQKFVDDAPVKSAAAEAEDLFGGDEP